MSIIDKIYQKEQSNSYAKDYPGFDEAISYQNSVVAEGQRGRALRTERTTAEIAAELQSDYESRQESKKQRVKASNHKRRGLTSNRGALELTMLKSGMAYECAYCKSKDRIEVDHITPISKGGGNGIENLQFLCKLCNISKSNKIIEKEYESDEQITLF